MRYLLVMLALLFAGCNPESSPEGRMNMKLKQMEIKIDSLKAGQDALRDSIGILRKQINDIPVPVDK
ncbi:hypothetical protein [Dyadobacter sp. MSC1_007]|jgi:hypothetical protein|uniref:hypothetical protein n=1 Tax=Dyadobacter sp. MSC1_007 TaxID=2909264 RepID=UPI00202FDD6D|nr:hypothetical protein [Dyadobacter sp. MSC1_007]